jgi:glycosyltransferase involved in cell wall biosynthesis
MASTQRVKLMARGLTECGADVTVLCTQVTERLPSIENTDVQGTFGQVRYEYTTGTTIRSESFLVRRWVELKGISVAIRRLVELKRQRRLDCVYYYGNMLVSTFGRWVFYLTAQILNLPLITEVCERPWTLIRENSYGSFRISPLWGVSGAVVISAFLEQWARQEAEQLNKEIAILKVPILVDVYEQKPSEYSSGSPKVLFAGSPGYDQTLTFILEAMKHVWKSHPECQLVITGCRSSDPAGEWLANSIRVHNLEGLVELAGYLTRQELLERYSQASALLIPLFNDLRSKARFPTKIGEYLASCRPVVTNDVGEVSRYLVDNINAYICVPGEANLYGQKIVEAIDNPRVAARIGLEGRRTAEQYFHYSIHSKRLGDFFRKLC